MNYKSLVLLLPLFSSNTLLPNGKDISVHKEPKEPIPITVTGYIKHESYWDTRQVVGSALDHFAIYPEKKKLDSQGNDINAKGQFEMIPIETRMRATMEGLKIKNASFKGILEADFFGKKGIFNIIRMRHAQIIFDWDTVSLLGGQAYHPFYVLQCYPGTINFNGGVPIEILSRNPQIRVTYSPTENIQLIGTALSQLDFTSDGPQGFTPIYMANAVMPMLDAQIKGFIGDHVVGAGVDYMRIVPRLETNTGLKTTESLGSIRAMAFTAFNWEKFQFRLKGYYAQNATDFDGFGGYAVSTIDSFNDQRTYTNLNCAAAWFDCDLTRHKTFKPGLFFGFVKNLGANETVIPNLLNEDGTIKEKRIFGQGTNVRTVIRISPRFRWKIKNFELGAEIEYTRAAYGTINECGDIGNTVPVSNVRILAALYYYI